MTSILTRNVNGSPSHILNLDLDNVLYPVWLNLFIIDSKYFPDSDWLKAHA